ncbi:MAG: Fe-S cluster assembly ATPase SufC [Rhodospirillaceae bacterium]|nr:Fe-S cluster assembly ATPase SufC [Rhodospirillaceae bacterium]
MLEIRNLHARVDGKDILRGLTLSVNAGEVHALMGPNGSGKSTLAYLIAGRAGYERTDGEILYQGRDLLAMNVEERAREGVFLGFQYPVEIPGVSALTFLKSSVNAVRKHRGLAEYDAMEFLKVVREKAKQLDMPDGLLQRPVNVGFSGGEKKRHEIFQMALLEPTLALLDETDSGLDIDALRVVASGINRLRDPSRAILVITHYQRLLDYVVPDRIHVMAQGRLVKSGDKTLAAELEKTGYAGLGAAA